MYADGGTAPVGLAHYADGFCMPTADLRYADVRVADGDMLTGTVGVTLCRRLLGLCRRPWAVGNVANSGSVELLLRFIYPDTLSGDKEGYGVAVTQHLLVAADRYGVDKLKQACDLKLRRSLDVRTVATTLALVEQHQCPLLRDACATFMSSSRKVLAGRRLGDRRVQTSHGEHPN